MFYISYRNVIYSLILSLCSTYIYSMEASKSLLSIRTQDEYAVSCDVALFQKYGHTFEEVQGRNIHIPFSRAEFHALAFIFSVYDKNRDSYDKHRDLKKLKAIIAQFFDSSIFPLTPDFIWFRFIDYFNMPLFNQALIAVIADSVKDNSDHWFVEQASSSRSWRNFIGAIKRQLFGPFKEDNSSVVHTLVHAPGQRGHLFINWSPNGQFLATLSSRTVKIWDVQSGVCMHEFTDCVDDLMLDKNAISWSADSRYIITQKKFSAFYDMVSSVGIWDVATGRRLYTVTRMHHVWWSPEGHDIATSYERGNNSINIWDVGNGECKTTLSGHTDVVKLLSWSPAGCYIATYAKDTLCKIWTMPQGSCVQTFDCGTDEVKDMRWSPNGLLLATLSYELEDRSRGWSPSKKHNIKIWNVFTGKCLHTFEDSYFAFSAFSWSPDSRFIATYPSSLKAKGRYSRFRFDPFDYETVKLWDIKTGKCVHTLKGDFKYAEKKEQCWSPNGKLIAFISVKQLDYDGRSEKSITVWDVKTGSCLYTFPINDHPGLYSHLRYWSFSWSPEGDFLLIADIGMAELIDIKTGLSVKTIHLQSSRGHAWSPNGRHIAAGSTKNVAQIWDLFTK